MYVDSRTICLFDHVFEHFVKGTIISINCVLLLLLSLLLLLLLLLQVVVVVAVEIVVIVVIHIEVLLQFSRVPSLFKIMKKMKSVSLNNGNEAGRILILLLFSGSSNSTQSRDHNANADRSSRGQQ